MKKMLIKMSLGAFLAVLMATAAAAEKEPSDKEQEELREEMREVRRDMEKAARRLAELGRELGHERAFSFELGDGENMRHFAFSTGTDRAMLGVTIGAAEGGVEVLSVTPGGPADKAGLQSGDIITNINGTALDENKGTRKLTEAMKDVEPGKTVELAFKRGKDKRSVSVTAEAFEHRFRFLAPDAPRAPNAPMVIGHMARFLDLLHGWGDIELAPVSEELGRYFGVKKGLLVVRSPQEEAMKLQDGDVILSIGGREPEDTAHAMRILDSYRPGEKVQLEIMRDRKKHTLEVEIPERRIGVTSRFERGGRQREGAPR